MADIVKNASAGTLESSDVYVEIEPGNGSIDLTLDSVVQAQFGDSITKVIMDVLESQNISSAVIRVTDRGALDCVISARVEAAVKRGMEE